MSPAGRRNKFAKEVYCRRHFRHEKEETKRRAEKLTIERKLQIEQPVRKKERYAS